jgi:hypothetical protein
MTLKKMVEVILDRRDKSKKPRSLAPFRLGELFFPVPRSENKAVRFWPEYFRQGSTS